MSRTSLPPAASSTSEAARSRAPLPPPVTPRRAATQRHAARPLAEGSVVSKGVWTRLRGLHGGRSPWPHARGGRAEGAQMPSGSGRGQEGRARPRRAATRALRDAAQPPTLGPSFPARESGRRHTSRRPRPVKRPNLKTGGPRGRAGGGVEVADLPLLIRPSRRRAHGRPALQLSDWVRGVARRKWARVARLETLGRRGELRHFLGRDRALEFVPKA